MHFCTAKIKLAGDVRMEVVRDAFNPVSYPEIEVIRSVHGESSVNDVVVIADAEQTAKEEKQRLQLIYGLSVVEDTFPGKNPRMEMAAPKATLDPNLVWRNPLDKEIAGYDLDPTIQKEIVDVEQAKTETKQAKAPSRALKDNPFE